MLKHKILFLKIIISLSVILFSNMLFAQTLTYKNISSKREFNSKIEISKTADGYIIKKTHNKETHIYNTDKSFSTLKWIKSNPDNNTDITAERKDNKIFVTGKLKNEKFNKNFSINELPWYQEWGMGLKEFINSNKEETYFWSIDPKNIRIAKFIAKKEKTENINFNDKKIDTIYTTVNLTGFLKLFWDGGKMWFRNSDGICIRMKMDPKDPNEITDLIEEK